MPQDLTENCPGGLPIPEDDYVKKYQRKPELWPVEFFVIAYRRATNSQTGQFETQILVRRSANGTSRWGLGTGVPATRWLLSTQEPPRGYAWSEPRLTFDASSYPEFPPDSQSWTYDKIDIREDAFNGPGTAQVEDRMLEDYAREIREALRARLSAQMDARPSASSWEASRMSVVKRILDEPNSVAAIQGTLRMSGLFAPKTLMSAAADSSSANPHRHVALGNDAPDAASLAASTRIYTMFPQMPDPLPEPSTPLDELQAEIASRASRMAASGRDPHKDSHGRVFTHISTNNPSNTIHGVYLTLDATDLPDLDEVLAFDLFGTRGIEREWVSLQDLKVMDPEEEGGEISTEDPKPTFISGFIVRQLLREGVIDIRGPSRAQ